MFGRKKDDKKDEEVTDETTLDLKEETPADITATTVDEHTEESEEVIPPITWKEIKALKKAKYDKIHDKFNTSYVLLNKRTGQIVEINAASPVHACNMVGWKPRKVRVLETKEVEKEVPKFQETTDNLGKENDHQEETA